MPTVPRTAHRRVRHATPLAPRVSRFRSVGKSGKANAWHTGLIPGTSSLLVRRWDRLNWAVLFNTDATAGGKQPANLIDSPMHTAADAVKTWPDGDLFEKFPGTK